ncbi:MAG TPA: pyridoxal-phosphate dependent enzyme [Terriglobales bacterium]|jgi:threonine dehydratase|nr:pyridoxal-phosphate dependent enzyme [Terriglobales bacterium]
MNIAVDAKTEPRNIPAGLIDEARQHVYEAALRTPLVRLNYDAPAEIYLKLECLQPIGSFKIRGAYNAVRKLPEEQRRRGVWTVSAGNAAQGVALAARKAGVPCQVLVIAEAPATKLEAARRLGAELVKASYDDCWKALEDRAHPAMKGSFVHPFEDDDFIAGNASVGLEILEDLPGVDAIVAGFGGGGLSCGIAAAMRERAPQVKVFAAEPETASPLAYSFAKGSAQKFPNWQASWVDGCGGKSVFPRMWALAHHLLAGSIVATLEETRRAMRIVAERNHVIAEGAGACAVAAGLSGKCGSGKVVCVVSGGNIDLAKFTELVLQPDAHG